MCRCYNVREPPNDRIAAAKQAVEAASDAGSDAGIIDSIVDDTAEELTDGGVGTLAAAFAIRRAVFVIEQGVDPTVEWDDAESDATHLLLVANERPIGAARGRVVDANTIKAERVAVRRSARNEGWGRRLMAAVEAVGVEAGADRCLLHAQRRVEGFYHALGYRTVSEPFEEAGIPHVKMERVLPTQ
ncbi:MAG: putative acyltransferase [Halonotius sp. J07HN4]|nr:MAG: putative acyltransferase [Halonotius sp. J07HN4]